MNYIFPVPFRFSRWHQTRLERIQCDLFSFISFVLHFFIDIQSQLRCAQVQLMASKMQSKPVILTKVACFLCLISRSGDSLSMFGTVQNIVIIILCVKLKWISETFALLESLCVCWGHACLETKRSYVLFTPPKHYTNKSSDVRHEFLEGLCVWSLTFCLKKWRSSVCF